MCVQSGAGAPVETTFTWSLPTTFRIPFSQEHFNTDLLHINFDSVEDRSLQMLMVGIQFLFKVQAITGGPVGSSRSPGAHGRLASRAGAHLLFSAPALQGGTQEHNFSLPSLAPLLCPAQQVPTPLCKVYKQLYS